MNGRDSAAAGGPAGSQVGVLVYAGCDLLDLGGLYEAPLTAGGLSCGLDLGLHLVERLVDGELAASTAAQIAHPYAPTGA